MKSLQLSKKQEKLLATIIASKFVKTPHVLDNGVHNSYRIAVSNKTYCFITFIYQTALDNIWFNIQIVSEVNKDITDHVATYKMINFPYLIFSKLNDFNTNANEREFPQTIQGTPTEIKKFNKALCT